MFPGYKPGDVKRTAVPKL